MSTKPEWTVDEIVTNFMRLDLQWQRPVVNFAFAANFTAAEKSGAALAFQYLSDIIDLDFAEVSSATPGDGKITFSNASLSPALWGDTNWTFFTQQVGGYSPLSHAEIQVNTNYTGVGSSYNFGTYDFMSMFHEIGHALGVAHPGPYGDGGGSYSANAVYMQDSRQYTVMSYFDATNTGGNHGGYYASTPLLHDVAALQALYGANTTTRTGDTTYGFNNNSGRAAFDFSVNSHPVVAIWDAGGTDTIDLSGYSMACKLDLNEGAFSDVGGLVANVAVAFGAVIENGVGGSGDDEIIGTSGNNKLTGGDGNDTLRAGAGTDTLVGGAGNDKLVFDGNFDALDMANGGLGTDTLVLTGTITSFAFSNATSIEALGLGAGSSYSFELTDGTVAAGATLTIDGSLLNSSNTLIVDGLAEQDGKLAVTGGAGNDALTGGAREDALAGGGGNDVLLGSAGNDTFSFNGTFTAADTVTGGSGSDTLALSGTTTVVFGDTTMTGVETVTMAAGANYNLTLNSLTVGSGSLLTVNAAALAAANTLTLNGSSVAGDLNVTGGAGADKLTAGGGKDTFSGGAGDDSFTMGANMTGVDALNGGTGNDTVYLDGDYSLTFNGSMLTAVEFMTLSAGHSYTLNIADSAVASGVRLTVNANTLAGSNRLVFDGSGESNGRFTVTGGGGADSVVAGGLADILAGGAGNDTIVGGAGGDTITGGLGADMLTGGLASDTFIYSSFQDSLGVGCDTLFGFDFNGDHLDLNVTVTGVDAGVSGAMSQSTFEFDLAKVANKTVMASKHAVIVTVNSGGLSGEQYLVVDVNGKAGYQAAKDMVFHIEDSIAIGALDVSDFI